MKTKLFALILMLVLMLLSLVPAVHAETWTKRDIYAFASNPMYVMIYDIDNDTNPDVVVPSMGYGSVYWYKAPEDPTGTWTRHLINCSGGLPYAYGVFVYDMDNDGYPDVVASGYTADKVVWYENPYPSDPTISEDWNNYTIGSATGPGSVYVYDINGDGHPDVVASAHGDGQVVWYDAPDDPRVPPPGWPSENKHVIDSSLPSAQGVHVADMDGDGDPDVVAAADGLTNNVTLYACPDDIAARNGTWPKYTIDSNLDGAVNVDVYDIDGDGNPDVVATGYDADTVVWYEAPDNPNQTWAGSKHIIDSSLDGAWGVHIYSIDGWSTYDVVATADVDDVVVWYQGPEDPTATGATWTNTTIGTADHPRGVDVYDIDGNLTYQMEPDVVVSELGGENKILWYQSNWSGLWPIPEVPLGTILLLGTGLLIPVAIAAAKWLRLNHRLSR